MFSCTLKHFSNQNVSYSRLISVLQNLKNVLLENKYFNLAFNELNLEPFNKSNKIKDAILSVFSEDYWKIDTFNWSTLRDCIIYLNYSDNPVCPFVPCCINGVSAISMLDTGGEISLLDHDFAVRNNLLIDENCRTGVVGVSGSSVEVVGSTEFKLCFKNKFINVNCVVVRNCNLGSPLLIGVDIMKKMGFVLDFKRNVTLIDGVVVGWLKPDSEILNEIKSLNLKISKTINVPSKTKTTVCYPVEVNDSSFSVKYYNESLSKIGITSPMSDSNILFPIVDKNIFLEIHNNTDKPKSINSGTTVARVSIVKSIPTFSSFHPKSNKFIQKISLSKSEKNNAVKQIIDKIEDKTDIQSLVDVLNKNASAFATDEYDIGKIDCYEHRIDTIDDKPIYSRPYRTPHSKLQVIKKEIDRLLKAGVIKPSKSSFSSPCLIVYKRNGKPRLVVDYRKLNLSVIPIAYPLPHLETTLQSLGGQKYFSTLDLLSGYHQIPIRSQVTHKTAFSTGQGLYEFCRVPFGMSTSGAAMQFSMERTLNELNNKVCVVYIDDVIIFGKTKKEHDKNLSLVLNRLQEHGFKINADKCVFRKTEVECLGHLLSDTGLRPNPSRVECLLSKPVPKTPKQVKSFLGLCSYYRRFVPQFANIAKPLNELLRKQTKFRWSEECRRAFETLIKHITSAPCSSHPNFEKPFIITTDASIDGIGAVLSQNFEGVEKPIAFYSRSTNNAERKYPIFDLEGLAIKCSLQKWRYYLLGYEVHVRTDNQPIIHLLKSKECSGRISKYLTTIMEFNVKFHYLPGKNNVVADYLSRSFEPNAEKEIIKCVSKTKKSSFANINEIKNEQSNDEYIKSIKNNAKCQVNATNGLIYKNIKNDSKLVVPKSLKKDFLHHFHDDLGCHEGMNRTFDRLKKHVFWPKMKSDVCNYVRNCVICIKSKYDHRPKNELGRFQVPDSPFKRMHVDIIGPFPRTKEGYKFICAAIDVFSHYIIAAPLTSKSSEKVISFLKNKIINPFRAPGVIVADCGGEFKSKNFVEFCEENNIKNYFTSPYHHSSNGQIERVNYQIENSLRCLLLEKKRSWSDHLPKIIFSLNSSLHGSTKFSPYEVLNHKTSDTGIDYLDKLSKTNKINNNDVYENLMKANEKMTKKYNRFKRNRNLKVGDTVYEKNHAQTNKLKSVYIGPCIIKEICSSGLSYIVRNISNNVEFKSHIDFIKS